MIRQITEDSVLAAVQAGCDDIYQLAEHFDVHPSSGILRHTIYDLAQAGRVTTDSTHDYRIEAS